ncbi:MAG: ester cyclase [Chloroflexota bacterium]|jgi:predicted ester cyclase|nr:ester cyclase [Chloroflexota bacterium]
MYRPSLSKSLFILVVVCLVGLAGGGSLNVVAQDAVTNEEVVRRYFDELHTVGNLDVAEELIAPDAVFHTPDGDLQGPEGIVGLITVLRGAFANPEFPIEDLVAADDMVVVRWTMNGTHEGDFQGTPSCSAIDYRWLRSHGDELAARAHRQNYVFVSPWFMLPNPYFGRCAFSCIGA